MDNRLEIKLKIHIKFTDELFFPIQVIYRHRPTMTCLLKCPYDLVKYKIIVSALSRVLL